MSMLWWRQSAVAYRILHSYTLIYHSISWIICPATASLEQKNHDSRCSLVRLLLHAFAFLCREQKALSCETPTLKELIKFEKMRDGSESNHALVSSLCNKWWGLMNGAWTCWSSRKDWLENHPDGHSTLLRCQKSNLQLINFPQSCWAECYKKKKSNFCLTKCTRRYKIRCGAAAQRPHGDRKDFPSVHEPQSCVASAGSSCGQQVDSKCH